MDLELENQMLRQALEIYKKERERFKHAYPEFSGDYFISGGSGVVDDNNLPEYLEICPSYGCAWVQVYKRTDRTITFEGS